MDDVEGWGTKEENQRGLKTVEEHKVKAPNSNFQAPNNNQIPMTEILSFGDLDISDWDLFGIWDLELGI